MCRLVLITFVCSLYRCVCCCLRRYSSLSSPYSWHTHTSHVSCNLVEAIIFPISIFSRTWAIMKFYGNLPSGNSAKRRNSNSYRNFCGFLDELSDREKKNRQTIVSCSFIGAGVNVPLACFVLGVFGRCWKIDSNFVEVSRRRARLSLSWVVVVSLPLRFRLPCLSLGSSRRR